MFNLRRRKIEHVNEYSDKKTANIPSPVSLSFALYTWPYVPSPMMPIISNLSTQRFPQSL